MTVNDEADLTPGDKRAPASRRLFWITAAIAIGVVVVDQLTKWWAESRLGNGERIDFLGDFMGFVLVYNPGAAFSIGSDFTWIFTILSGLAAVGIAWYAWRLESRSWMLPLGLLLGGAITHFGDRLLREPAFGRGHVVDFIRYGELFVGNVADIALFFGVVLMLVLSFIGISPKPSAAR